MKKISLFLIAICFFSGAAAQEYSVMADSANIRKWFENGITSIESDSSMENVKPYAGDNFSIIFYHENYSGKHPRYYEFSTPDQWQKGYSYALVDREDRSTGFIYPDLFAYCYLKRSYTPWHKEYKGTLIKALVVVGKLNEVTLPENKEGYDISIYSEGNKPGLNVDLFGVDKFTDKTGGVETYTFFSPKVANTKKCEVFVIEKSTDADLLYEDDDIHYYQYKTAKHSMYTTSMSGRAEVRRMKVVEDDDDPSDYEVSTKSKVNWIPALVLSEPRKCTIYLIDIDAHRKDKEFFEKINKSRKQLDDGAIAYLEENYLCKDGPTDRKIFTREETKKILIRNGRQLSPLMTYKPNKTLPNTATIFFDFTKDN